MHTAADTSGSVGKAMTMDAVKQVARSYDIATKVAQLYQKRTRLAREHFSERLGKAYAECAAALAEKPITPVDAWSNWLQYATDTAQRSILFMDTLRQRGNDFVEHNREGLTPVLHFDYETVVDGRTLARPVNYALVRIIPPDGVKIDSKLRPYVIIDPRAGHGPGIGGFKDDSQVGVALRAGHPVYFVIFFRDPEPGQTLLDVCTAEQQFVKKVRELHPASAKPVIVGNCQGGWAAMMLAAADPEDTGPIVINGAPMSYWGGAFQEGAGDNPMRYAGGMLGGTWLSSYAADMGNGIFDGAYLVENFENLNPANTFWDKYYNLFANIDTEPPRFLEFERWWGGFYLMNREEIEWITRNLFVGNKLWTGTQGAGGKSFDLRDIKAPIILFASMGDNITPPQQAFNWVADVYGSTDEIKARGQVIVGLLHQDIGHLGIFVSGKVAKKEHAQIVEVLKSIEMLPPGLYGMRIHEVKGRDGKVGYEVDFQERRLEDIAKQLNRLERADEKPFEAVAAMSEFNQRAYELFAQPFIQSLGNEVTAKVSRQFHPLRFQRWAFSDLNPWLAWLGPAAQSGQGTAQGGRAGQSQQQGPEADVRGHQRIARLLPRKPRRGQRGGILPDLWQRVLALPGRQARGRRARRGTRSRAARTALRQGGAGLDRGGRLCGGAGPRRVAARAARRATAAGAARAEAGTGTRVPAISFPTSLRTSGGASAASRTSSCATSPKRRSRRCRSSWPSAATANDW